MTQDKIVIKPLSDVEVDVFTGIGWNNFSRFKMFWKNKKLKLVLVKGRPVTPEIYSNLISSLEHELSPQEA